MEHLKYPIGRFIMPDPIDKDMRLHFIHVLQQLPDLLQNAVKDLIMGQLTTPYREGGWTLLQVVHHLAKQSYERIYSV